MRWTRRNVWRRWFAWYPVKVAETRYKEVQGQELETAEIVPYGTPALKTYMWLTWVERRRNVFGDYKYRQPQSRRETRGQMS